jgi:hypothetical protein
MSRRRKLFWFFPVIAVAGVVAALIASGTHHQFGITVSGVVLADDPDPAKQTPIPKVEVTAADGNATATALSDTSGSFHLDLHTRIWQGASVELKLSHPDFNPLTASGPFGAELGVFRMTPRAGGQRASSDGNEISLANVRVRYAITSHNTVNVGSMARAFQVANIGNVPCERKQPCSPDDKWKATAGSQTFDAGEGNQFNNVRLSCIAGPCPFTRINSNRVSKGGRTVEISVLNWSDTTTFLFEAEVIRAMESDVIRQSFPAIFGRNMSFTLPSAAEGPSIEAELNGSAIVFPLGPALKLSWASCVMRTVPGESRLYACELKPGYRFR